MVLFIINCVGTSPSALSYVGQVGSVNYFKITTAPAVNGTVYWQVYATNNRAGAWSTIYHFPYQQCTPHAPDVISNYLKLLLVVKQPSLSTPLNAEFLVAKSTSVVWTAVSRFQVVGSFGDIFLVSDQTA